MLLITKRLYFKQAGKKDYAPLVPSYKRHRRQPMVSFQKRKPGYTPDFVYSLRACNLQALFFSLENELLVTALAGVPSNDNRFDSLAGRLTANSV